MFNVQEGTPSIVPPSSLIVRSRIATAPVKLGLADLRVKTPSEASEVMGAEPANATLASIIKPPEDVEACVLRKTLLPVRVMTRGEDAVREMA